MLKNGKLVKDGNSPNVIWLKYMCNGEKITGNQILRALG